MAKKGRRGWVFSPDTGGVRIPEDVRRATTDRIEKYAAKHYSGCYTRLGLHFHGAFCYVDAFTAVEEPSKQMLKSTGETRDEFVLRVSQIPIHLCRLRYFGPDRWSFGFYTYSNEQYSPCAFNNGTFFGTPEQAFEQSAGYLR